MSPCAPMTARKLTQTCVTACTRTPACDCLYIDSVLCMSINAYMCIYIVTHVPTEVEGERKENIVCVLLMCCYILKRKE